MNKQPELTFNPNSVQTSIGLRIRDLPESCTNELLYTQVFQKLKIDTKKVKAFKVKGHKTFQNCLGDAIVYFDSEDSAQDAMSKIIGHQLHNKTINCSLMMPAQDLKLKNGKNVYFKNLKSTVTTQKLYQAAIAHGQVLSILLKQNALGKFDGYACYKTQPFAELAEKEGIKIDGDHYAAKVLKIEDKNTVKKGTMSTNSRNIELHFDISLVAEDFDEADFENQLREQIVQRFNLHPTSLFVWGKRARHFARHSEQTLQDAFNLVNNEAVSQCGNTNAKGEHVCHEKPYETTCPVLSYFHKKAFVCFDLKSEAQDFLNQYYGKYCSETSQNADDKKLFTFNFKKGEKVLEAKTIRCIPEQAAMDKKYKELEEKLNPKVLDKNFIFFKNLKKTATVEEIKKEIETHTKTKVVSIKLSTPTTSTYIRDLSKVTETKFATIQLENVNESEQFIQIFKQESNFREKFNNLFEGYKYANYLAPKKLHKQELKNKNERSKKQPNKQPNLMFPMNTFPHLFNMNKQFLMNPQMLKSFPTMMPPFMPRNQPFPFFPQPFKGQQQQHRQQMNPSNQGNNNFNRVPQQQFNMNNNNNNKFNNQNRANTTSQGRPYQNRQQPGDFQKRPYNPNNQRGTTLPQGQGQNRQYQTQGRNQIQKPNTQPEKKTLAPTTAPVKQPIQQPAQPPKAAPIPKLEDLKDKNEEQKKQILGSALVPKINAELSEADKAQTNKIAGMLLDFEIYSVEEIIGMLNNAEDLKENIATALDLIQEATAQ